MIIKYPIVNEQQFLRKYLEFANLLLPQEQQLVPSEMDLMIEFALLPPKFEYQRFGTLAKDKVIEATSQRGWKLSKLNINNKLYALIDKKFLYRDEDKVIYMPKHFLAALKSFRENKSFEIKLFFNGDT